MRHVLLLIASILPAVVVQAQTEVPVVVSPRATAVEKLAASELASHLKILYPAVRFSVRDQARAARACCWEPRHFARIASKPQAGYSR